ncbi:MAG: ParB N-terminal domain-containing protein [Dehalococcoidia bacterium]
MEIRDRVKELRRVPASELMPHPKNWRRHDEIQATVLEGILSEVGFAGAIIARDTPEGLVLIDGHLRADVAGDTEVPVLVLDVTEEEAEMLLATLDPLSTLADTDAQALRELLESLETNEPGLTEFFDRLMEDTAPWEPDIATVEGITPTSEPITATLRIRCPTSLIDELSEALEALLEGYPEAELV